MDFDITKKSWTNCLNQLLLQNIQNSELTNADLAAQMYMSERAFYRKVKKTTGFTPNHYIRLFRLKAAEKLLQSGQYSQVKEVAYQVGFIKVSYFSNLFERFFGQRPKTLIQK